MPGCVLRASGAAFDVDAFLKDSALEPSVIYRKGQRRKPASRGSQVTSGFNVVICREEESLGKQVKHALTFLRANRDEIVRLGRFGGVEQLVLDFGCPQRETATRNVHFPVELLATAGGLGVDIEVSFYLVG